MRTTSLINVATTTAVAASVFFAYNLIFAWTGPTANPPSGNVPAPINEGSSAQTKNGDLTVNGLLSGNGLAVFGNQTIAANSPNIEFQNQQTGAVTMQRILGGKSGLYVQVDRNGDGSYDNTAAMNMHYGSASTSDYVKFANAVHTNEYCDINGKNCFKPTDVSAASAPYVYVGTINSETNANITTANNDCKAYGYDGVWATEDHSGTEDIICYMSNIVSPVKKCDVKMVSTITDSASGNPVAGPTTYTYQVLQGTKVYIGGWWGQSRSNPYTGFVTKVLVQYVHGGGPFGHSPSQNYLGYWDQYGWSKATFSSGTFSKVYHTLTVQSGVNDTLTFHNPTKVTGDFNNKSVNPVDGKTVTTISNCH